MAPAPIRPRAAILLSCLVLGVAGCTEAPSDPLEAVSSNLQHLRSGILELRVIAREIPDGPMIAGFELTGSFQAGEEGELPVADVSYRDMVSAGGGGRFISTGDAAFVVRGDRAYTLPKRETRWLRTGSEDPLFEDVELEHWIQDPRVEDGEGLDGGMVERVSGPVEVVQAVHDLASLSARFGGLGLMEPLEGPEAQRIEDAVGATTVEVISGAEDRVLRRLLLEVELEEDDVPVAMMLRGLGGRNLTFDLSISEPNRPVQVEPPTDPLPFSELPREDRRRGAWL